MSGNSARALATAAFVQRTKINSLALSDAQMAAVLQCMAVKIPRNSHHGDSGRNQDLGTDSDKAVQQRTERSGIGIISYVE